RLDLDLRLLRARVRDAQRRGVAVEEVEAVVVGGLEGAEPSVDARHVSLAERLEHDRAARGAPWIGALEGALVRDRDEELALVRAHPRAAAREIDAGDRSRPLVHDLRSRRRAVVE